MAPVLAKLWLRNSQAQTVFVKIWLILAPWYWGQWALTFVFWFGFFG